MEQGFRSNLAEVELDMVSVVGDCNTDVMVVDHRTSITLLEGITGVSRRLLVVT